MVLRKNEISYLYTHTVSPEHIKIGLGKRLKENVKLRQIVFN